jgi:ubiquinone/menaquinone biosynthesis C-methylase UbiE
MHIYKKFLDGMPDYLVRYYWWAYLWRFGIWFFDHQVVINLILFGQYEKLLKNTLSHIDDKPFAKILQLTCVYGKLTKSILTRTNNEVHICDVSSSQLQLARLKSADAANRCHLARMNAECLSYNANSFDQVIVFFLLHEMPPDSRQNTYAEIARVVKPGGSVLITEYAETPIRHWLYRFVPFRFLICRLEPFLKIFWEEDVAAKMRDALKKNGKSLNGEPKLEYCFARYYRIMRFDVMSANHLLN